PGDAQPRPALASLQQLHPRVDAAHAVDQEQPGRPGLRSVDRAPLLGGHLDPGLHFRRTGTRRRLGVVGEGRVPGVDGDPHSYSKVFSTCDPLASLTIRKRTGTRSARSATCVTSPTVRSLETVSASSVVAT